MYYIGQLFQTECVALSVDNLSPLTWTRWSGTPPSIPATCSIVESLSFGGHIVIYETESLVEKRGRELKGQLYLARFLGYSQSRSVETAATLKRQKNARGDD